MTTTARLLNLLSLLQTRRDWPGSLLAARLEVTDRTVRRDVERLREMGYRIDATLGPDGGYRLASGTELPPLLLDDAQVVAVAIALRTATVVGADLDEPAARALATIRQVMPSRLRHRLDALEIVAVARRPGGAAPTTVPVELLVELAGAIRDRAVLRFDYAPRRPVPDDDPPPPRRVEPHHLANAQGRWYLVAWDLERADWRLFSVERITPRTPTGPRFAPREVPGGDVEEFVEARFKGSDVNAWACRGSVILDLPIDAVLPFVGDGTAREAGPDRTILESGSWSWVSLAAAIGRFEVATEVIGPPELREAFATLAGRFAATAGGSMGTTPHRHSDPGRRSVLDMPPIGGAPCTAGPPSPREKECDAMPNDGFSAEEGALLAGAGHVDTARETLTTEIGQLRSRLTQLEGAWVGEGAGAFRTLIDSWEQKATRLTNVLDVFKSNLTGTDAAYGQSDTDAGAALNQYTQSLG
ncbi:WYL domain-containing protein [Litorihabitans aurantiacus]|uniref:HTH deoR-type domain-containing protein n=1 Tax=Litorihabitans aurantiacus TaxID=1930061 RepID=A0AA37XFM2_9MICO|nr:hypothetical protein GCM10025875_23500 [Litorihabitans aurantiacus]